MKREEKIPKLRHSEVLNKRGRSARDKKGTPGALPRTRKKAHAIEHLREKRKSMPSCNTETEGHGGKRL